MQINRNQLECFVDHLRVFEMEFCLRRRRLAAEHQHPKKKKEEWFVLLGRPERKERSTPRTADTTRKKKYINISGSRKWAIFFHQLPERRVEGTRTRTLNQSHALRDMNYPEDRLVNQLIKA